MNTMKNIFQKTNWMVALFLVIPAITRCQSLWVDGTSTSIFADKRSLTVGSIITIAVSENSTANKNNATATERKSSLSAAITSFLYPPGATPIGPWAASCLRWLIILTRSTTAAAPLAIRKRLSRRSRSEIIDVLPNGNLVVQGKRETSFSHEQQQIVLRGIVRPEDVLSNNTVFSYNVADATIEIIGKGTVSDGHE